MAFSLALVTGATSGIGKEICRIIAENKIELIATGRNSTDLDSLSTLLSPQIPIQSIQADLNLVQDRERLIAVIHERKPDLVINNAGFGLYGDALTYTTDEQSSLLEVNGKAVLELTLEASRTLASEERQGIILNVSSAAGFQVMPSLAVYAAIKSFVTNFSQALDFELKSSGIRVLTFCPGMVKTAFQSRAGATKKTIQPLGVMTARFAAEQIWKQIEQLQSLRICDWKYHLMTYISSFIPNQWKAPWLQQTIAKRIPSRTLIRIKK